MGLPSGTESRVIGAALDAGFVFWGLFAVFGVVVVAYVAWMVVIERREGRGR
jgi:phage shock protein PspC (stress-responsive transcriptional regulator)